MEEEFHKEGECDLQLYVAMVGKEARKEWGYAWELSGGDSES